MKKRKLASWAEYTLIVITMVLFIVLAMVDSIELKGLPLLLLGWLITGFNIYVLVKWGKGRAFEKED